MYRYVAERAVVHVGIADDRFTVAAAGGVAVEQVRVWPTKGCDPLYRAPWAVAGCGWRRTAACPKLSGCWL